MNNSKVTPSEINEKYLIILKKDVDSVTIDYVEIHNPIRSLLDEIYRLCDDESSSILEINELLKDNEVKLKPILSYLDYCHFLSSPYQGIESSNYELLFETENKKDEDLTEKQKKELIIEKKGQIKQKFKYRDFPYAIQKTYELCRADTEILAHSHRSVGWAMRPYKLINDFSIQFKSNFGYGRVSYFYSILKYKDIDIIPFSEWVIYQNADLYEIIRYSLKHRLKNESWYEAMNYAETAINTFNNDKEVFIKEYIIDECKKMVDGLEDILNNHIFSFKQYNGDFKKYNYQDKRLLIKFRGEKISGALKFIANISDLEEVIEVQIFIDRIIDYNKIMKPILMSELDSLVKELDENNNKFSIVKPKYEKHKIDYNFHKELKQKLSNVILKAKNNDNHIEKSDIDKCFNERYPNYTIIENDYLKYKEEYDKLNSLIWSLESLEKSYTSSLLTINQFLDDNE